jgi:hypothetical protein
MDETDSKMANSFANDNGNAVSWAAAIGRKLTVKSAQSLAVGYNNTIAMSSSCSLVAGEGLNINTAYQTAIGKYNATDTGAIFMAGWGSSSSKKNAATIRKPGTNDAFSKATKDTDLVTLGFLKTYSGSGLPDCSGYKDGAILVVRNGQWVIENPPTAIYTGEVE